MDVPENPGKDLWSKGRSFASALLKSGANSSSETSEALATMVAALQSLNRRRLCPICMNEIAAFARYNRRRRARCRGCGSLERHRAAWLYLKRETRLFLDPTRLLHIAAEPFFANRMDGYITIDQVKTSYDPEKPDEGVDIQKIAYDDDSFDMIFCSHVLEHVPDDRLAMRELLRVLRPGGLAVIIVPIRGDLTETYEDDTITTPEEREKHFGQWDHLRWYGRDFPARIREQGFDVETVHYADHLSIEEQLRYGIRPEPMFACRKPD